MSLPTVSVLNAAIDTVYSVFADRKTRPGNRYAVGLLQKMRRVFLGAYRVDVDFTVTDNQDESLEGLFTATIAADTEDLDFDLTDQQDARIWSMFQSGTLIAVDDDDLDITDDAESLAVSLDGAGVIGTGLGQTAVNGDIISVIGANDTTDNALQAAKGSAPVNEDQFMVIGSADALWFLGNKSTDYAKGELFEADVNGEGADTIPAVGGTFRVQDTADTQYNDLYAKKGDAAVAAEDLFIITNLGSVSDPGSASVDFLGNAAIVEGEVREAFGRAPVVGDIFQVGGSGDTNDNALQNVKGSAPADGDVFEVTGAGAGSWAIKFLGAIASISTTDEEIVDFVSLGA